MSGSHVAGSGPEDGRADGPGPAGRSSAAESGLRVKRTLPPHARGSPPTSSASSSSLTNDVAKQPVSRDLPPSRPGATGAVGTQYTPHSHQFPRTRKMFDKGPEQVRTPRGPDAQLGTRRASRPRGSTGVPSRWPPDPGSPFLAASTWRGERRPLICFPLTGEWRFAPCPSRVC